MASNGAIPPETEDALVVWVNSFPLTRPVESLRELNDGQALWQMLRDIDGEIFTEDLPNNKQTEYSRRQNLEYIHRRIQDYLDDRGKLASVLASNDLQRMAMDETGYYAAKASQRCSLLPATIAYSILQFLKLIFLVILIAPRMQDLVATITNFPLPIQLILTSVLKEVADMDRDGGTPRDDSDESEQETSRSSFSPSPEKRMDQVLQLEEQCAKTIAQLERRNREYADLETELQAVGQSLARSQETNDALKDQIIERDDLLKKQRSVNSEREILSMKDLESKISEQEVAIADKDSQISKHQTTIGELQRESKTAASSNERLQKLQDEFDVTKVELERQTRKANTADKYMQKLQSSQSVEKERDALRLELDDALAKLAATEKLRQQNAALQLSNDETSRTLSQIEQEHDELRMTKKQLRMSYESLAQQVDALNERFAQDQETIADLRDRGMSSESNASPTNLNGGLEGELAETKSRLAELDKQNQRLSSDASEKDAKIVTLQRQLDNAQNSAADSHVNTQRLRQEILSLHSSLGQVRQGHPIEGTETFKKMRDQVKEDEVKILRLEEELSTTRKDLEVAKNDLSLVDKSKLEILEQVKNQQSAELTQTQSEKSALQKRTRRLEEEFTKQQLASTEQSTHAIDGKIADGRERLAKHQKRIEDQDAVIKDLEKSLQQNTLAKTKPTPTQDPQEQFYIQNLKHELNLMATAYHDLAGRLKMDSVVLQRRAEAPKNLLGKMRKALEGPVGLAR